MLFKFLLTVAGFIGIVVRGMTRAYKDIFNLLRLSKISRVQPDTQPLYLINTLLGLSKPSGTLRFCNVHIS